MKKSKLDSHYHRLYMAKLKLSQMLECANSNKTRFISLADPIIRKTYGKGGHKYNCHLQKMVLPKKWKYRVIATATTLQVSCIEDCNAIIIFYDSAYDCVVFGHNTWEFWEIPEFLEIEWRDECFISRLPSDVIAYCLRFINRPETLFACRLVSKQFCTAASSPTLWRPHIDRLGKSRLFYDKMPLHWLYATRTFRIEPSGQNGRLLKKDYLRFGKALCRFIGKNSIIEVSEDYSNEIQFICTQWFAINLKLPKWEIHMEHKEVSIYCRECNKWMLKINDQDFVVRDLDDEVSFPVDFFKGRKWKCCRHAEKWGYTDRVRRSF